MFVADWIEKVPPQAYMFENLVLRRWCYLRSCDTFRKWYLVVEVSHWRTDLEL